MNRVRHAQCSHAIALVAATWLLASCGTTVAAQSPAAPGEATTDTDAAKYPTEILGQWEPGPRPCRLPLTYDSDAGFRIESRLLQGYEHTNTPAEVRAISDKPKAWRIASTKRWDEDQLSVTEIFVLREDLLTVTDGQRSTTYQKCYQQDAAATSVAAKAEYPQAMHGVWMPEEMGCPTPLNYDSESLLSIGADMLGQYENTTKPLAVEQISQQPPAWRILSTFSPGTGEYEGKESSVYVVDRNLLTIEANSTKSVFIKCK